MNCDAVRDLLDEYLDGELATADRAAVEEHLGSCASCRAEWEALRRTAELVASLPRVDAPQGLADGVKTALERTVTTRRRALILRWATAGGWLAAAATLALVIRYAPWGPEGTPRPDAVPEPAPHRRKTEPARGTETKRATTRKEPSRYGTALGNREKAEGAKKEAPRPAGVPAPKKRLDLKARKADAGAPGLAADRMYGQATAAGGRPPARGAEAEAKGAEGRRVEKHDRALSAAEPDEALPFTVSAGPAVRVYAYQCADTRVGLAQVQQAVNATNGMLVTDNGTGERGAFAVVTEEKQHELISKLSLSPVGGAGRGGGRARWKPTGRRAAKPATNTRAGRDKDAAGRAVTLKIIFLKPE